jgi:hypothetical protein
MLVEALQTYLSSDDSVSAQLGVPRSDKTTGIFPVIAPSQCGMPYIVFSQITGEPTTTSFEGTNSLQTSRWRFACYGSNYLGAKVLAKVVKQALLSFNGATVTGEQFLMGSWLKQEADDSEPIMRGILFSTHLDFEFLAVDGDTE